MLFWSITGSVYVKEKQPLKLSQIHCNKQWYEKQLHRQQKQQTRFRGERDVISG